MTDATAITQASPDERIEIFMRKPETLERFTPILGKDANAFISSALILINSDPKLQACTTMSLYKSVLRAASLQLSLDQSLRQGWIIPRKRKVKAQNGTPEHYVEEATFQPHYNGLRNLAERTGKYWVINVSPVYEGQHVWLDQLTGLHFVETETGLLSDHAQVSQLKTGRLDVTTGAPAQKVIGYIGYYKTKKGVEKTVWMTIEEIHKHAEKWAPEAYNNQYGAWKDKKKLPTMEMKTVFIQLTKTMDLSGKEDELLRKAIAEDDYIEGETKDPEKVEPATEPPASDKQTNPDPVKDATWNTWLALVARADKVKIEYANLSRENLTDGDLRAYVEEIAPYVANAEQQAEAA